MTSSRRKARIVSLQALYESDCTGHDVTSAVQRLVKDGSLSAEAGQFAQDLAIGVEQNKADIDAEIRRFAPSFPVEQMLYLQLRIAPGYQPVYGKIIRTIADRSHFPTIVRKS